MCSTCCSRRCSRTTPGGSHRSDPASPRARAPRTPRAGASSSTRETTSPGLGRSVAEVRELQGHAEVVFAELGDRGLQVVALLTADPQLVTLHLMLHALQAERLHEL